MPALLETTAVESKARTIAGAESWPDAQPGIRHNPHKSTLGLLLYVICAALIVVGVILRVLQLDQVPGVNGDEAWYGVQAQWFLDEYVYKKELPPVERVNFRTPTGNVWNPFLMIPRILLDAMYAPSVWSLRLPALLSGLLTLLFNWSLCRRALNPVVAWLTTALLALLPITVIYSRLDWDACQSVMFCLPLLYLPWIAEHRELSGVRTAIYFGLALLAALLVHPTNIFIVPLSAMLFWPRISAAAKLELSLYSRVLLAAAVLSAAFSLGISRGAWAGVAWQNVNSALGQWSHDTLGLFHGATVYGSISLPADELPTARFWLLLMCFPTGILLIWTRITDKKPLFPQRIATSSQRYAALFDGTCLAWLCFLGVAGPSAISPGYERYGLWMIAPGILLIVMAYAALASQSAAVKRGIALLAAMQIALMIAGYWHYFQQRFQVPATEQRLAHWTYRTDNFADWSEIHAELERTSKSAPQGPRKILCIEENDPQRWWFEWKWRYLSHGSEYQWQVISSENQVLTAEKAGEQRWLISSLQESAKKSIAIRYLSK